MFYFCNLYNKVEKKFEKLYICIMVKPFKLDELVIWQDEQTNDITGLITNVKEDGFTVLWDLPDGVANKMFYRWEYLNLKTPSGKSVIQLDISRIRDTRLDKILV